MRPLLAKSPHPGRPDKTLAAHTADVLDAVEALFGTPAAPTRLGDAWQRFFRLADLGPFYRCTMVAAAAHDWGKANDGFQRAVRGEGEQLIRHEHLSGLMLATPAAHAWLTNQPLLDPDVVQAAVLGHHLKASYEGFAARPAEGCRVRLLTDQDDFVALLQAVGGRLGLSGPPPRFDPFWHFEDRPGEFPLASHAEAVRRRLRDFERRLRQPEGEPRRRLLWAVRAALIAADAAGSALPRVGRDIRPWVEAAFDPARVCTRQFVEAEVIGPRVEDLRRQCRWRGWDEFQTDCDALPDRALLLAPCGSGKTLAAWRWIAARLAERPAARVLFLYPTRATATEGFRDYVSWAPEADAALLHGTAEYDLRGLFATPDDPGDPRGAKRFEAEQRLYALGVWSRRVFAATVDQFLAFLQYGYGSVCLLPLLADAVVVIDEVHSFDRGMFSALKDLLRTFDVPALCMTASFPEARRRELVEECGLREPARGWPKELRRAAEAPRYRIRLVVEAEVEGRVRRALAEGRRVLWVVNQVRRAQDAARRLATAFPAARLQVGPGVPLYCYHSRFRLVDRRDRHQETVRAFQGTVGPALAITSQVCEMSLDLDADLLVTEWCPVTALIQRLGRCNRARQPRPGAGEVLVYRPPDERPYDRDALAGLEAFLGELAGPEAVSQARLQDALRRAPAPPRLGDKACSFLESGPYAQAGEETFRDIEEFTVPAILARDVPAFLAGDRAQRPGLVVPVPRKLSRALPRHPDLPSYLAVADDAHYHPALGFCDQPLGPQGGLP
jgi:CRISPR-associated endonuclease/helicase Cas3